MQEALAWLTGARVALYASDFEVAREYADALDDSTSLPIHPCYLADWAQLAPAPRSPSDTAVRVLLYSGDAKPEKGFDLMPAILQDCLTQLPDHFEMLVQFTAAWGSTRIEPTIDHRQRVPAMTMSDKLGIKDPKS